MLKRLKLMADYNCDPLWDLDVIDNLSPDLLPLSRNLVNRLQNWQALFDRTLNQDYPPDSSFVSVEAEIAFEREGLAIAKQLQAELGDEYEIYYQDRKVKTLPEA